MKQFQFLVFLVALLLWGSLSAMAQSRFAVSGVVTDEHGESLPGVSVVEKDTHNGTVTDIDGRYALDLASGNGTIVFSYVGYQNRSIAVAGRHTVDVKLEVASQVLDDVVVVGYGTQKKVNLTGSVASINFGEKMEGRPIVSVSSALAGMAAGMTVSQSSGQPGSESASIRIRGNGTFNSNSPLILVDGIEWSLDNINPNDIESISVLKDASSAAIYGTRAANGVVLVTTKKGAGKPQVTYSYSAIRQTPYQNLKFVSDYARYMELANEACENMGTTVLFSQQSIDAWKAAKLNPNGTTANGVLNSVAYPNTDWFDELFETGWSQEHNLSVNGSGERAKYLISFGYLDNQGVMNRYNLDSSSQKFNFRTNVEGKITDWLSVGTRVYGQKQDYGMADLSTGFGYLYQTTPGVYVGKPYYWGRAALASEESSNANNLLYQMAFYTGYNTTWRLNATGYLILSPIKGLNVEATFNYSPTFTDISKYTRPNGDWDYVNDVRYRTNTLENATITNTSGRSWQQSAEIVARYNTTINKVHDLGALVGFSSQEYMDKSFSVSRKGAADWTLHELSTYETLTSTTSTSPAKWGLLSYFGRVNYAYKSRYLVEANLRADGSSRFGDENRWGYFPSFSAGWRLMEESFMEELNGSLLSNLKLRASWGRMGNNSIGNYDWMSNYVTGNVVIDGSGTNGLYQSSLSNKKLHWETTTTTDVGLDFGLFDNRLTGELDWYNKSTTDILYHPSIYLTMGTVSSAPANLGEVRNRGFELSLNWRDTIGKELQYSVGVNFAYNDNEVIRFKGKLNKYWETDSDGNKLNYVNNFSDVAESGFGGYICEGRRLGETYMYRVYRGTGKGYTGGTVDVNAGPKDGMIRTEEDMAWVKAMIEAGHTFGGMKTVSKSQLWYGDRLYADLNGDGNYGDSNDRDFTGHSYVPRFTLGINLAATYKNIDFSMIWSGAFGHYLSWTANYYNSTLVNHGYGIIEHIANDHYFYDPSNPTDSRTNLNGKYTRLTYGTVNNNNLQSDWNEYKADYLKLKNVQLGYTLPQNFTKKFFVSKLRAFVSMDNILTITGYPGMDPEIGTSIGYPLMRQISFGGQITF